MTNRILMLGSEESVTTGVGNSTTVGGATLVRVFNSSNSTIVLTVDDPQGISSYSGAGSISIPTNGIEYIEKPTSYNIYSTGGNFKATKVGFTN
tara:strand:+ start:545 stop:826 length:282 start_codon:yes stop_codon:yes gene_type:complete